MIYEKINKKNGEVLTESDFAHLEDGIYQNSLAISNSTGTKDAYLYLPEVIRWETGKPLYLFKHAIISAFNYKEYNLQVILETGTSDTTVDENKRKLKDYPRYILYSTNKEEERTLIFKLYNNNHVLIDTKQVILKVINPTLPENTTTLLFIGDSLTYYNRITDEFYRIMTEQPTSEEKNQKDTISIYNCFMPKGRGSDKINIIGTQLQNHLGWTGKIKHEGMSGWGWGNFISSSSPFYSNGALNFNTYCNNNNFSIPDVVYIGLGWNDTKLIPEEDYTNTTTIYNNAKTFLSAMAQQWPNTKIRLWTQNVPGTRGGIANHPYGASGWADEHKQKLRQLEIAKSYVNLAKEFPNVEVVWTTAMIDSEYCLQEEADHRINYRITEKEVLGKDYVHPADSGYFQIVDGIVSDFMHCLTVEDPILPDEPEEDVLEASSPLYYGCFEYQGALKILNSSAYSEPGLQVIGKNIEDSIGKKISLKICQPIIEDAYYILFLKELPLGLKTLSSLADISSSLQTTDLSSIVEKFNIDTNLEDVSTLSKYKIGEVSRTIPEGTKYIFFSNASNIISPTITITD